MKNLILHPASLFLFISVITTSTALKTSFLSKDFSKTFTITYHLDEHPWIYLDGKDITKVELNDFSELEEGVILVQFKKDIFDNNEISAVLARGPRPVLINYFAADGPSSFSLDAKAILNTCKPGDRIVFATKDGDSLYFTIGIN